MRVFHFSIQRALVPIIYLFIKRAMVKKYHYIQKKRSHFILKIKISQKFKLAKKNGIKKLTIKHDMKIEFR